MNPCWRMEMCMYLLDGENTCDVSSLRPAILFWLSEQLKSYPDVNPIQSSSAAYHFWQYCWYLKCGRTSSHLPTLFLGWHHWLGAQAIGPNLCRLVAWDGHSDLSIPTCSFGTLHILLKSLSNFVHWIFISNGLSAKDVGMVCNIQILPGKKVHL